MWVRDAARASASEPARLYAAMRRTAYVCLLLAVWAAGMALVVFWLDNWLRGDGRAPLLVVTGAWMAATATVALGGRRVASAGSTVARMPPTAY